MSCDRCGLVLPAGAEHRTETACILALRVEVEKRAVVTNAGTACASCGQGIPIHFCPPCAVRAFGRGLWNRVGSAAEQKILEKLEEAASHFLGSGFKRERELEDDADEGDDLGGSRRGRPAKKFRR